MPAATLQERPLLVTYIKYKFQTPLFAILYDTTDSNKWGFHLKVLPSLVA